MGASTYTFLFTDIEGSTRLWELQPEAMRAALDRHNAIIRTAVEAHHGRVFRTAGDAFFASFRSAPAAVAAAVEAQRNLHREKWCLDLPLRVRMALHTGEAEEEAGDYVGSSLNRIGRLIPLSHGGQILLTRAVQELVRDGLQAELELVSLGQHHFRDLTYPEQIYQVRIAGLPSDFPPLNSLQAVPNNLPLQLTSFIGRDDILAQGMELLRNARLLTITGTGGTGKTRLGLQLAASQLEVFPDGVWFIELASLTDPALLPQVVAGVLNVREHPQQDLHDSIRDAVRGRRLLIILDNCEHLIEACARFAAMLLKASEGVKILACSREALAVPGEIILPVPPLSVPADPGELFLETILDSEAVQLFVERARSVQPHFQITEQNAAAIAEICRYLDGIPLAIELAAARIRLLTPQQIAARLGNLFGLLSEGNRAALPRQQTLKALVDWSYELLAENEQDLLRMLSVFNGGWTLEAAEAIWELGIPARGEQVPSWGSEHVLDLLSQLVNKSLVMVDEQGAEVRFRMLETIRQYAAMKLAEANEVELWRTAHLKYFSQMAHLADAGFRGGEQLLWNGRLERDHDNLRAALEWGLQSDPLASLEMGANLDIFWSGRGYSSQGRRWLQAGLDQLEAQEAAAEDPHIRRIKARALYAYGIMAIIQGDNLAARDKLEAGLKIMRQAGDRSAMLNTIPQLSLAYLFLGEIEQSQALAEEGESLGRELQDPIGLGLSLSILAQISMRRENGYQDALDKIQESSRLLREHGNRWFSALSLMGLGIIAYMAQDYPTASEQFIESKKLFQQVGDLHFANVLNSYQADVARQIGEFAEARRLYRETLKKWIRIGHRGGVARCLECLGLLALAQALQEKEEVLLPDSETAGILLGAAGNIRQTSKVSMTIDEAVDNNIQLSVLRAQLDHHPEAAARFENGLVAGSVKAEEEVLALVL
jgi:predicted ATPase/class 3 adenylate cyclase